MIQVQDVCKRFGEVDALKDVSFTVKRGQIVGFLGANGAGKTTIMDIISGCLGADKGSVKIGGQDILQHPRRVKRMTGYLPDLSPLHNDMTVEGYLRYVARLRGLKGTDLISSCDNEIERSALNHVRKRLIGNLSKGYQRRVGLAQALVHNPAILIFDEPTDGLDPAQIVTIRDRINALRGEHTVVFSSHILSEVENICDEIIIIDNGMVVEQGSFQSLAALMEPQIIYRLKIAQNVDELLEKIQLLPGVIRSHLLDRQKQILEIGLMEERVVDDITRFVLDGGFGLREVTQVTKSLEEVYFHSTGIK